MGGLEPRSCRGGDRRAGRDGGGRCAGEASLLELKVVPLRVDGRSGRGGGRRGSGRRGEALVNKRGWLRREGPVLRLDHPLGGDTGFPGVTWTGRCVAVSDQDPPVGGLSPDVWVLVRNSYGLSAGLQACKRCNRLEAARSPTQATILGKNAVSSNLFHFSGARIACRLGVRLADPVSCRA